MIVIPFATTATLWALATGWLYPDEHTTLYMVDAQLRVTGAALRLEIARLTGTPAATTALLVACYRGGVLRLTDSRERQHWYLQAVCHRPTFRPRPGNYAVALLCHMVPRAHSG